MMARLKASQRREQLLRVAASIFARYGYDGTTTASIAAGAGITEPLLYRHFRSKQALFAAIVQDLLQHLETRWEELFATTDDPVEQLRMATRRYARILADKPDSYRVLNGAILTCQDPAVLDLIRAYYAKTEQEMTRMLKAGQQRGVFRSDMPVAAMAWIMIDMGIGYAIQETKLWPGRFDPELFTAAVFSALKAH